MERKQITFDTFVRGFLGVVVVVGIVMLLNRLSGVLVPFFLAWLLAYLLFPLVKFFQYRCRLKFRIAAILLSFLIAGAVLTGVFWLMIPPMIEEGGRVTQLIVRYVQTDETMSNIPRLVQQYIHDNVDINQLKKLVHQDGFIDTVKSAIPKVWAVIAQSISIVSSVFSLTMVTLITKTYLMNVQHPHSLTDSRMLYFINAFYHLHLTVYQLGVERHERRQVAYYQITELIKSSGYDSSAMLVKE